MKHHYLRKYKELKNSFHDIFLNLILNKLLINLKMKRKLYKLSLFKEIDEFNQRDSDGHYSDDSSDDFLNTTLTAYGIIYK